MEISVDTANVDIEMGTVILKGYDINEIINELGVDNVLDAIDYSYIKEFVAEVEERNKSDEYDAATAHLV